MTCEHKRLKHGYEKTYDVQWCLDCGVITHTSDGLIGPGLHKRADWSDWINVNLEAWSCRNEAHDGKRCSHWCGGSTCPASIRSVATTTQNDSISVSEVSPQKPDWDAASEAMRWLNDIEIMQGGKNGPTIKLRTAIKAMQTEAANALYMVRADKAQTLMDAEKAMAQIREATAKVVKEHDEARADLAAAQADIAEMTKDNSMHVANAAKAVAEAAALRDLLTSIRCDIQCAHWHKDIDAIDQARGGGK